MASWVVANVELDTLSIRAQKEPRRLAFQWGQESTPARNRTWNLRLRRPLLYPIELPGQRTEDGRRGPAAKRQPTPVGRLAAANMPSSYLKNQVQAIRAARRRCWISRNTGIARGGAELGNRRAGDSEKMRGALACTTQADVRLARGGGECQVSISSATSCPHPRPPPRGRGEEAAVPAISLSAGCFISLQWSSAVGE